MSKITPVSRFLLLIPYIASRPGVSIEKISTDFGITKKQVHEDLQKIWTTCGLPGYGPGELIDLSFSQDNVSLIYGAGIDIPLRLNSEEASSLILGLMFIDDSLNNSNESFIDKNVIRSAIEKLESAFKFKNKKDKLIPRRDIDLPFEFTPDTYNKIADDIEEAIKTDHAIKISYYSATTDQMGDRIVYPELIEKFNNYYYLKAWCLKSNAARSYRLDRCEKVEILNERRDFPKNYVSPVISDTSLALEAVLKISPDLYWIIDYLNISKIEENVTNKIIKLKYFSSEWLIKLVMSFSGNIEVIEPKDISNAIKIRAEKAIELYLKPV